jgi:outer membrane protein assembly factor BamA
VDLTRTITGPLRASVMLNGSIADYSSLSPTSTFQQVVGSDLNQAEGSVTGALVLDLRDNEYDTRKGLLAEAGGQFGISDNNYTRWYGIARGWMPATKTTVVAARIFVSNMTGTPTLLAQQVLPGWESPYAVLGSEDSHRALPYGRFTGTGLLGTNFEVRQGIITKGEYGALGLVLFLDAGRSFENDFKLTFDDWTVGGGGGLVVRILRGNVFILTYGITRNESHVGFRTGWMF